MTVLQRAREIIIMRLVGASDWFVRGPFLLEGALKGFLGGALAVLLCYLGYLLFQGNQTGSITGLVFFQPLHVVLIVVFGILLGLSASLVSVGRHLRNV
jgi:cell division transport system permease protein